MIDGVLVYTTKLERHAVSDALALTCSRNDPHFARKNKIEVHFRILYVLQ